jgi:hypothetical protein
MGQHGSKPVSDSRASRRRNTRASMAKPPRRAAVRLGAAKGCGHRKCKTASTAGRIQRPTMRNQGGHQRQRCGPHCETATKRDWEERGQRNAASQREGRNENAEWQPSEGWDSAGDAGEAMGRPNSPRPQERPRQRAAGIQGADADGGEAAERQTQPPLGRDADGPADWLDDAELYTTCDNRTDELRLLGNGVVPAVAERAFRLLFGELTAHNTTQ